MPFWHRLVVLGAVLLVTVVVARLVDRRMARRDLPRDRGDPLPGPAPRRSSR